MTVRLAGKEKEGRQGGFRPLNVVLRRHKSCTSVAHMPVYPNGINISLSSCGIGVCGPGDILSIEVRCQDFLHALFSLVAPGQLHGHVWPDEGVARVQGCAEALLVPDVDEEGQEVFCQGGVARFCRRVDGVLERGVDRERETARQEVIGSVSAATKTENRVRRDPPILVGDRPPRQENKKEQTNNKQDPHESKRRRPNTGQGSLLDLGNGCKEPRSCLLVQAYPTTALSTPQSTQPHQTKPSQTTPHRIKPNQTEGSKRSTTSRSLTHLVHLVSLAEGDRLLEPSVLLVHVGRDAPELEELVLLDSLGQGDLKRQG